MFNFARLAIAIRALYLAKTTKAEVLVAHGPTLTAWCGLFKWLLHSRVSILAFSFNFATVPGHAKRLVFRLGFAAVDRFVTFSRSEQTSYEATFGIPVDRFDFIHWGIQPPKTPEILRSKEYVCAIGGNGRDYSTLLKAARRLSKIRFVVIGRPENFAGEEIPSNVEVYTNSPLDFAMTVMRECRFMVLPLKDSEIPCGHVTLVAAMHFSKATILTRSSGVMDYVTHGRNALLYEAGNTQELSSLIEELWGNPILTDQIGRAARDFAMEKCTEVKVAQYFRSYLDSRRRTST